MRRLVLLAVFVAACGGEPEPPLASSDQLAVDADNVVIGLTHNMTKEGVRSALLYADTAYVYEDSSQMELRRVRLTLYDESGRKTADVTSQRGRLNTVTRQMTVTGAVDLKTTQSGQRIQTEELHYDPQSDRLWSDVRTVLTEQGTVVRGSGFTSDSRLRNLQVRGATAEGVRLRF